MNKNLQRLLILATVAGSLSCMKTPELEDKVTPASAEEVSNALVDSWGTISPLTMLKGDFIYQETEQQIDTMESRVVLQEGTTISNITETAEKYDYTFLYQTAVISGENSSQSTREDHRTVTKNNASSVQTSAAKKVKSSESSALQMAKSVLGKKTSDVTTMGDDYEMTLGFERVLMLANSCVMTDDLQNYCKETLKLDSCEIKCGNLTKTTEVRPAPDLIKQQSNCGGLANCKMNVKKVTFDWQILMKTGGNTEKQKVTYTISMTPDLPFLPRVLDYCSRGLVQIPNSSTKVLVTVCNRLKNFQRNTSQN
ncbi:hypothetical protein B9G69_005710 [Bdellovibrio sp. SKB1291214]|uniref:hypothetical protein n=1 Tax=Bdellovibrio sp. SKB1291214 TaxID=1732569 RepID=UPI00223FFEA3|nr:hypothetical protein [Bdellovibrio sp. SKB1291214]UYL10072.1 hypothetical protein B9G69_005710 [Bdellovibrio sp. SKB1291214]